MLSSLVADSEENIIPQITFRPGLRSEYNCPAAIGIQIYLSIYICSKPLKARRSTLVTKLHWTPIFEWCGVKC
jgi:hypothetical protein